MCYKFCKKRYSFQGGALVLTAVISLIAGCGSGEPDVTENSQLPDSFEDPILEEPVEKPLEDKDNEPLSDTDPTTDNTENPSEDQDVVVNEPDAIDPYHGVELITLAPSIDENMAHPLILGRSYSTDYNTSLADQCINGSVVNLNAPNQLELKLNRSVNYEYSNWAFNLKNNASLIKDKLSPFSFSSQFNLENVASSTSVTAFYAIEVSGGRQEFVPSYDEYLNTFGKSLIEVGAIPFFLYCGQGYVRNVELGGIVVVSATYQFEDESTKVQFQSEVNGGVEGLFDFKNSLEVYNKRFSEKASVSIEAFSSGGDISLIPELANFSLSPSVAGCPQSEANCANILANLSETLLASQPFLNSIKEDPVIIDYSIASYVLPLIPQPVSFVTEEWRENVRRIAYEINHVQHQIKELQDFIRRYDHFSTESKYRFLDLLGLAEGYLANHLANGDALISAYMECYSSAANCRRLESVATIHTPVFKSPVIQDLNYRFAINNYAENECSLNEWEALVGYGFRIYTSSVDYIVLAYREFNLDMTLGEQIQYRVCQKGGRIYQELIPAVDGVEILMAPEGSLVSGLATHRVTPVAIETRKWNVTDLSMEQERQIVKSERLNATGAWYSASYQPGEILTYIHIDSRGTDYSFPGRLGISRFK